MIILSSNFYNSSYFQFLQQERQEIDKLKWIESEKAGADIGINKAFMIWHKCYRGEWMKSLGKSY